MQRYWIYDLCSNMHCLVKHTYITVCHCIHKSGSQHRLKSSLVEADFSSSSFIMPPVPKTAFQLCAVAALASGLTLSSLAPRTLLPPLPLGALAPALLASALNLTLMQSERPLALLRHPYPAPSVSGLQSTASAFHLLSFRLRAPPSLRSLPQLHCCCWDAGL